MLTIPDVAIEPQYLAIQPPSDPPKPWTVEAASLREKGYTYAEIASAVGRSTTSVWRQLARRVPRHGHKAFPRQEPGVSIAEALFSKALTMPSGCWEWQGSCKTSGYGLTAVNRQSIGAHQLAWRVTRGPIPKGLYVLHTCDNRICINPRHLYLGTHAQNMRDMSVRGHAGGVNPAFRGNAPAHLDAPQAKRVCACYHLLGLNHRAIAALFQISPRAVFDTLVAETVAS